ncbi:HxlR family transcriptional regulator [Vibrio crassostreae]|uniref:winged helix-turn-helix transcriptional regulator n=1 Tax=Vibrio crassostreae TaxID=246167 RepID=UPI0010E4EE7B|nr:helix-turn-helix domain-containing protein [Vibrio crassostreae]TCV61919.1 HxlR family transcriptional regulator [Vibrio crassostreae]CAK2458824.1 HxlR family transcriptional regulator [Vibrio crassostreae]CAK2923598.1 HxlR family transcriptional regulator [Vibrio crassostreae]CAK3554649.1 HxlR family transcriptional regulator [Vibrio crassostreae]
MLTQTLRDLERDGYVSRTVYPEVPVRVEYELTSLGSDIVKPLYALVCWADTHTSNKSNKQDKQDKRTTIEIKISC